MKLQTSIPPRRDGTVRHTGKDSRTYVFAPGPDGELTADVDDEKEVAFLLSTGMFWPENPEDFEQALSISTGPDGQDDGATADTGDDDGDDGQDDDDVADGDDAAPVDALPVEANTPPVTRRKPGPKPKAK